MKLSIVLFIWIGLLISSCKKSAADSDSSTNPAYDLVRGNFTDPPFDTSDITALVPLGNLNPPAHTFPTDHMYFYCFTSKPSLEIKSPGNVRILRISRIHINAGAFNDHYDYKIAFGSSNSYMYWDHVSSLSPRLLAAVNNFTGASCEPTYSTGGSTYQGCYVEPAGLMTATGEVLGTIKTSNGLTGMDLGVYVNKTAGNPLEFFDTKSRSMLEAKLGSFDGKTKRTAIPISGEYNYDLPGTAMGNWIKQGFPRTPEDNNIALVKDNVTPSIQVFSAGNTLPGLSPGTYYFKPQSSGFINRNFAEVTGDGNIYCYTLDLLGFINTGNSIPSTSIIIRLDGSTSLSAEKRNCDCSCLPYQFTSAKVLYTR
jgi:hypothetical protein